MPWLVLLMPEKKMECLCFFVDKRSEALEISLETKTRKKKNRYKQTVAVNVCLRYLKEIP